jgi:uncharacterized membrane protein
VSNWSVFLPTFLAATVEWVEAFTIVLAVALSIGWLRAMSAAAAALVVLGLMTVATGGILQLGGAMVWLQFIIGVFLLLFGVRWLAKAIARQAGLKALHDEDVEFSETRAQLSVADTRAAWLIAFKGVLLEGLEVWLIVVALGLKAGRLALGGEAALLALLLVATLGLAIRAPLRRIPENAIKFVVGAMIVSFGTFWTLEASAGAGAWLFGDWSLLGLVIFYGVGGQIIVALLKQRRARLATP